VAASRARKEKKKNLVAGYLSKRKRKKKEGEPIQGVQGARGRDEGKKKRKARPPGHACVEGEKKENQADRTPGCGGRKKERKQPM